MGHTREEYQYFKLITSSEVTNKAKLLSDVVVYSLISFD